MTTICLDRLVLSDKAHAGRMVRSLGLLGVCGIMAAVGRAGFIGKPFGDDPAVFIYMGKFVAEGGQLYRGLFDTKPPGVAMVMSGLWRVLGTWWVGYVLLQMLLSAAAAWGLGMAAGRSIGPGVRRPVMMFAAVYLNFYPFVFSGFQLETLLAAMAVLAGAAALASIHRPAMGLDFLVGLAAGCAAMIKPGAGAVALAYAVALWFDRKRSTSPCWWKRQLCMGAGLLLPMAGVLWWSAEHGILALLPMVWREIRLYAQGTPLGWLFWIKLPLLVVVLGFPVVVRLLIRRREWDRRDYSTGRSAWCFVLLWLGLELVGVMMQRRMYVYYFLVLVPPMALVYGMLPRRDRFWPMAAGLWPAVLLTIWMSGRGVMALGHGVPRLAASDYLLAHTGPEDAIWGEPMCRLVLETGRPAGARLATAWYFANHDEAPREFAGQLLQDWERTQPKYIVLPIHQRQWVNDAARMFPMLAMRPLRQENYLWAWDQIFEYLAINYEPEAIVDGLRLYRRKMPAVTSAN